MDQLIIYDTSNYEDFPIGGQLTSIRNFLKFLSEKEPRFLEHVLLVGVTTVEGRLGVKQQVVIGEHPISFLPVVYRSSELSQVKSSLRIEFLKGLIKYNASIPKSGDTVHFIHSPEAFIALDLLRGKDKKAVFSHGSFFNMVQGFRFFNGNRVVGILFDQFIKVLLKRADLLFALDQDSIDQYQKYNKNVYMVDNSIVLPERVAVKDKHVPLRLLFLGRLSKVKQIDKIIKATALAPFEVRLTIVGDGELKEELKACARDEGAASKVFFVGAVVPDKVRAYLEECDVLVMNSVVEGKPMTMIEAMGYGLPIVTTAVGGILDLLGDCHCAEITDGTEESIVNALTKIRENYEQHSLESLRRSRKYDYRTVNHGIYDRLKDL